jgi:NADH-quinone oxidoreductase subunit M
VLFYVFFEITLVPMYLLVGVWGDQNRRRSAIRFFVYTFLGSTTMLAGFLALGILSQPTTFSMAQLSGGAGLSTGAQIAIAAPILFGLLVKVPAVPLHSWLLDVYVSSPTSTNVVLSGILPKLGTYGLIKVLLPLLPQGVEPYLPLVAALGVINIIYGAFVAFMQPDLKALVAYSSIGTLGFILLGIASGNAVGLNGAVMQQVTHGLYSALLFILVGVLAARTGTRRIRDLGGLAARTPFAASMLAIGALAAMGLPGLAVFVSEFMSIMGGYEAFPIAGALAATGIIWSCMYLTQMLRRTIFGPAPVYATPSASGPPRTEDAAEPRAGAEREPAPMDDASPMEMAATVPLAFLLILLGVLPGLLISVQTPAVQAVLAAIGGS